MGRGTLRIYLGAAPGVGTTYAMLAEGHRRAERGTDVVIGVATTRARPLTEAQLGSLERIAPALAVLDGLPVESMDVDAVLARQPTLVLVDDLSKRLDPRRPETGRWAQVDLLLAAGIDVVTTLGIREVESLADVVERITGSAPVETVPDAFVRSAEQIELIDMTPEALRRRLAHGNIGDADLADPQTLNLYRPGTLGALRELALLWVADRVEDRLLQYMDENRIDSPWETRERVVVAMTGAPGNDAVIRRAARIARRSHGELVGVHVHLTGNRAGRTKREMVGLLDEHRTLLLRLGGRYHEVVDERAASALVAFSLAERATQLVIGASRRDRWEELRRGSVVNDILRNLRDTDVHVIATFDEPTPRSLPRRRSRPSRVSSSRRIAAMGVALVGLPVLTVVSTALRTRTNESGPLLAYLLLVAVVSTLGGAVPGVLTAIAAFALANFYFTEPRHTFTVNQSEDLVALVAFVSVAGIIAALVGAVARHTADAERARAEAEALARATGTLVGDADPLPALLAHIRATFGAESAELLTRTGDDRWHRDGGQGDRGQGDGALADLDNRDGRETIAVGTNARLVLHGVALTADDRRLLWALAAQLAAALAGRALQDEAAQASLLADANELRTAMLQSVSHDLRTPLASIKASVTSLLQSEVRFTEADQHDLLETIDEESDRLDRVVGNLLDMSRLQANALEPTLMAVDVDDVVGAALVAIAATPDRVLLSIRDDVPAVWADPVLLERALANLLANALVWSPSSEAVRVSAAAAGDRLVLRIADRGPGIDPSLRDRVFEPFQRVGDRSSQAGVGLGLAVARGFVLAVGGTIDLDDTPGGGLTVVVSLAAVPDPPARTANEGPS
jgi:two-component system sensor histidine kinase KdpD